MSAPSSSRRLHHSARPEGRDGAPPPCPPCLRFVMALQTALLGDDTYAERRHVLDVTPQTENALLALSPPDAVMFELARQAARIWARSDDPVRRRRWAKLCDALVHGCVEAVAESEDPVGRARRAQTEHRLAAKRRAKGED